MCERVFVYEDVDQLNLHWLAGLLEGEGSFFPGSPSNPHQPVLSVSMTDAGVMARVGELMERKVYRCEPRQPQWSVAYVVRLRGKPAVSWMHLLRPLMGERRQAQIDRALASYKSNSNERLYDWRARRGLELLAKGKTVKEVAGLLDVSIWCIYDLRLGRTHKHLSRPA
jgi:hypothetical protein